MNHEPSLIDEFIEFIKALPHFNYEFESDNKTLHGLRLKKYVQYPWKNKKEEKAYAAKYMDPETEAAYLESIKWMNVRSYEKIHILYSWAFVLRMSSVFMLLFSILNIVFHAYIGSLIYLIIAILLFLLNKWFLLKANDANFSRSFTESLLHLGIEQLKENPDENADYKENTIP